MSIEINGLKLENYNISLNIFDKQVYLVYGEKEVTDKFIRILLGINKPKIGEVLYNKQNVFDNEEYFKNRIYLDFSRKYLSTLTPSIIKDTTKFKYDLNFNEIKFKLVVDELNIRRGTTVASTYEFTKETNTCVNYALLKGLLKPNVFINEPFININDEKKINYIMNELFNPNIYNLVLIKTYNIEMYCQKPVKIIWFSNTDVHIIEPKKNKFILVMTKLNIKNCIYKYVNGFSVCFDLSKEEIKTLNENKIKYKEISFSDIFKLEKRFLGE